MTPRRILVAGCVLLVLYAFPGFMSYDSVLQLLQARAGEYSGGHPAMMGVLWGVVDALIPGPLGMLLIQVTCFIAGAYLLLARWMQPRTAAITTVAIALFPAVSAVLGVIWKDSQMVAYLTLGAALLLSPRRNVRLGGLALLWLATAMRYNAFAITLPLIVMLFEWRPGQRWVKRYPIALAAWAAVTLSAGMVNNQLASDTDRTHVWHESIALLDLTGTLRFADDIPEPELRDALVGVPLVTTDNPQRIARMSHPSADLDDEVVAAFGTGVGVPALWVATLHLFEVPSTPEQRESIGRAWRRLVLGHPLAYLQYRWYVMKERIHLGDAEIPSATYVWFSDVGGFEKAAERTEHYAVPSKLQKKLHAAMLWLGTSWLFRPWIYLAISLVLVPFAWRDRAALAVLASGIANEAALFIAAPTVDYRYSIWLVVATLLSLVIVVARRAGRGNPAFAHNQSQNS